MSAWDSARSSTGELRGKVSANQLWHRDEHAGAQAVASHPLPGVSLAAHAEGVVKAPGSGPGAALNEKQKMQSDKEDTERGRQAQECAGASFHERVFEDLRRQGFTMTCGTKFGTDFLAYRGDPSEVHSLLMVKAVEGNETVPALHLLSLARLALAARKHLVLACPPREGSARGPRRPVYPTLSQASDVQEGPCQERECPTEGCRLSPSAQHGPHCVPESVLAQEEAEQVESPETPALKHFPDYYTVTVDLDFIPRESKTEGHKMRAL